MSVPPADPPGPAFAGPPEIPPKSWQDGVAPAFITLYLGVVYLDRLAPGTMLVGGLGPAAVGACLAGVLGYWCLYYASAMWGATTRRPLSVVATSTFGMRGATYLPGLVVGVAYILWFAATIDFATQYGLAGLEACGLLDRRAMEVSRRGVPSSLFLVTAAAWSVASAVIGTLAVRLVAAVMSAYVVVPAIVIGSAVVWALPSASRGPVLTRPWAAGGGRGLVAMAGLIFSFLACHGLTAADWGSASKSPRDARIGGLVGVMLAAPILAILSMLIVAGSLGRSGPVEQPATSPSPSRGLRKAITSPPRPGVEASRATLRSAFSGGIGGRLGGAGLLALSLGLLGAACSTPWVIARQFSAARPSVPRWVWSLAGAILTWPLIATGLSRDVGVMFPAIGVLTAPAAGAIAADYARSRGAWPGPRSGWNLAGVVAWAAGFAAGVATWMITPRVAMAWAAPPAVVAFLVGLVTYAATALIGMESGPVRGDDPHPSS